MEKNREIIAHLNTVLKTTLTGINQYFLHARLLKHWGVMQLADMEYKESIAIMKYADMLVERILALEGLPNLQALGVLRIGEEVEMILENDLQLAEETARHVQAALSHCEAHRDEATARLLAQIAKNEAEHIALIRAQRARLAGVERHARLQTAE